MPELGEFLGEGSFGKVYQLKDTEKVVKFVHLPCDGFQNYIEPYILLQIKSIGIMNAVEVFINQKGLLKIVQEKGIPLDKLDIKIIRKEKKKIKFEIREGLKFLHFKTILHGDIKPNNILVVTSISGERSYKINDFSFSMLMSSDPQKIEHLIYSPGWRPSEVNGGLVSLRSDIWCYGKLIYHYFGERGDELKYNFKERPTFVENINFKGNRNLIVKNSHLTFKNNRHRKIFCDKLRNKGNHISCSKEYLQFERELCNEMKMKIEI